MKTVKLSSFYLEAASSIPVELRVPNIPFVAAKTRVAARDVGLAIVRKHFPTLCVPWESEWSVTAWSGYTAGEGVLFYFPCVRPTTARAYAALRGSGIGRALRVDAYRVNISAGDLAYAHKSDRTCCVRVEVKKDAVNERVQMAVPFILRMAARNLTPREFQYDRAVGVEMECYGAVDSDTVAVSLPSWARVGQDGSIRPQDGMHGHEVRALLVRREMEPRLFRLCQALKNLELRVNASCGMHVHLDQRGQSKDQVTKRARVMDAWLCALQELVPVSRRANNYCRFGISASDRYRAVNLTAFGKYQTIEIRLHSGTVDYTKILAWIRLCELLAALSKKPKAAGCIATLEQLPLASHDLAYWRARHQELNPSMYNASGAANEQEG